MVFPFASNCTRPGTRKFGSFQLHLASLRVRTGHRHSHRGDRTHPSWSRGCPQVISGYTSIRRMAVRHMVGKLWLGRTRDTSQHKRKRALGPGEHRESTNACLFHSAKDTGPHGSNLARIFGTLYFPRPLLTRGRGDLGLLFGAHLCGGRG